MDFIPFSRRLIPFRGSMPRMPNASLVVQSAPAHLQERKPLTRFSLRAVRQKDPAAVLQVVHQCIEESFYRVAVVL